MEDLIVINFILIKQCNGKYIECIWSRDRFLRRHCQGCSTKMLFRKKKFKEKHLLRSLFEKAGVCTPGVLLWILRNLSEDLFYLFPCPHIEIGKIYKIHWETLTFSPFLRLSFCISNGCSENEINSFFMKCNRLKNGLNC